MAQNGLLGFVLPRLQRSLQHQNISILPQAEIDKEREREINHDGNVKPDLNDNHVPTNEKHKSFASKGTHGRVFGSHFGSEWEVGLCVVALTQIFLSER